MIQSAFFGLFNFVANNKWAQIVLGIGVFYLIWRANEEAAERRGARRQRDRAEKQARKTQDRIERTLNEKSAQTRAARASVQPVDSAGELPDSLRTIIISD